MAKKGVTELRIQSSVLRRVVADKLQALRRGDFYVRNHLGEENYGPIVAEVKKFDEGILLALMQHEQEQRNAQLQGGSSGGVAEKTTAAPVPTAQLQFSKELEAFIQILAASIMIDASMRGENAGESDTRFIKKKKKMLTRMLMGGKLYTLRREIIRFDLMNQRGVTEGSEELIAAIGVDPPETEVEEEEEESSSESESEEEAEEDRRKKRKYGSTSGIKNDNDDMKSIGTMDDEDSSDDEDDDSLSDTATSENTSLSKSGAEDGFSASATSSKKMKKAKKKARKEEKRRLKKERKRQRRERKEKKRLEKEERKRKRKFEKEQKKRKKMKHHHHHHDTHHDNDNSMEEEQFENDIDDEGDDEMELDSTQMDNAMIEEASSFEFKTKEDFDAYRDEVLSQIPKSIRKRFRQGGFSKWGKDWLPVIELGPFDVEPGPVRDMWMDMFHNTQKSGRDMTHLVFWYGVKFEDRGQGFSFVPDGKIVPYEEGHSKGYSKLPKKIQTKIDKNQKLTKTEEQIKNGLGLIVSDMALDKADRIKWMMNFKEDYELAAEAEKAAEEKAAAKLKRKPGRPKKEESPDKPKRGPGRPKKVVEEEDQPKRKPGRPKKSEQAKAAAKSTAQKYLVVDDDQPESNIDTDNDEDDENYGDDDSDSDDDLNADTDSDTGVKKKKGGASDPSSPKKPGRKPSKPNMTEEEKAQERRDKAAAYREKKAREKAEALGLEYVPGRKGRKSKATIMEEEQMKFTKCEEVFCPLIDRLEKARSESDADAATECLNLIMKRVELVTPPFLRTYGLGIEVKQTRKAFESTHPTVKDKCKRLTNEMKRLYTERDKNIPDEFEPVKNMKDKPKLSHKKEEKEKKKKRRDKVPSVINSEQPAEKLTTPKVKPEPQQHQQAENPPQAKLASFSSTGSIPDVVKSEPQKKQPVFSIKGMFERPKPKPAPRLKTITTPNVVVSDPQMSPRAPKSLPSWVTGPAVKMDGFHEQHAKERSFGLEFLVDAASKVSSDKFDPISVSQSFELAIFAETKLRGRDWKQYWEKVHDIVAMLSPGLQKPNAILQGIKNGNYQEPSELVKLSRREIETVNNLT